MRLLLITQKCPFPPTDGGSQAVHHMAVGLAEAGAEVTVLAMCKKAEAATPIPASVGYRLHKVAVNTKPSALGAFMSLFESDSYFMRRFRQRSFAATLKACLEQQHFDVVQIEHTYLCSYIPTIRQYSQALIVLRPHNIEHEIWAQRVHAETNPIKKWLLERAWKKLQTYEQQLPQQPDAIVPLSEQDALFFKQHHAHLPCHTLFFGLPIEEKPLQVVPGTKPLACYHLAAMDWWPNVKAMEWFLAKVWPILRNQSAPLELHFAGKAMPGHLLQQAQGHLQISGAVDDVSAFIAQKHILIVPLWEGSGIRIKIIEALAYGKMVVSTSVGAKGLPKATGPFLRIADSPEAFAEAMCFFALHHSQIPQWAEEARAFAKKHFDRKHNAQHAMAFYAHLLGRK